MLGMFHTRTIMGTLRGCLILHLEGLLGTPLTPIFGSRATLLGGDPWLVHGIQDCGGGGVCFAGIGMGGARNVLLGTTGLAGRVPRFFGRKMGLRSGFLVWKPGSDSHRAGLFLGWPPRSTVLGPGT